MCCDVILRVAGLQNDAPKAGGQTIKIQVLADPGACIQSLHSDVEDSDQSTPVSVNKVLHPDKPADL